jgi:hypothetical protein
MFKLANLHWKPVEQVIPGLDLGPGYFIDFDLYIDVEKNTAMAVLAASELLTSEYIIRERVLKYVEFL